MKSKSPLSILLLLISATVFSQNQWIGFTKTTAQAPVFTLVTSTRQAVSFELEICGMYKQDISENNVVYSRLSIPGAYPSDTIGSPEIPVIKYMVAIPECSDVHISYTTVSQKSFSNYNVYPTPNYELITNPDNTVYLSEVFEINNAIYQQNKFLHSIPAEISKTGYLRSQKYAEVIINPISYNPATGQLQIAEHLQVDLTFENPTSEINQNTGIFNNVAANAFVNYTSSGITAAINDRATTPGSVQYVTLTSTAQASGIVADYLIITDDIFYNPADPNSQLTRMAQHRADYNGFDVAILNVENIMDKFGNPNLLHWEEKAIREFIKMVYEGANANHTYDGKLAYVLLVGDVYEGNTGMPTSTDHNVLAPVENEPFPTDYYYSCITESSPLEYDDVGDLFIGRFSVQNQTQLYNMVQKTIMYETEYTFGDWRNNIGFTNGSSFNSAYFSACYQFVQEQLQNQTLNIANWHELNGEIAEPTLNYINNGVSYVQYHGHGGKNQWENGLTTNYFETNLNNSNNTPFINTISCNTGWFDSTDCLAEALTRNSDAKGAVGYIGSSRTNCSVGSSGPIAYPYLEYQNWYPYYIFNKMAFITGEFMLLSKISWQSFSHYHKYGNNLFGDPALNIMAHGYRITQNTTLRGNLNISTDITVTNGATLTLGRNCNIHFDSHGKLIVDEGAKIVVAPNVTFTRQHNNSNIRILGDLEVNGRCTSSVDFLVENGGNLVVKSNSLKLQNNAGIVVFSGSALTIFNCKEIELASGSQIVVNAGGILKIFPNAILNAHQGQAAFSVHTDAIIHNGCVHPNDIVPPVYIIKGDTHVWERANYPMARYLVIESGAKLVLNSPSLRFFSNAGIIVKEGGELQINNGALYANNNCAFEWKGITVEGTTRAPQLPEYQGFLFLNNSTIKDATIGVKVKGGGVLVAINANFMNNITSIIFERYRHGPNPNLSGVFGSTFSSHLPDIFDSSLYKSIELTEVSMVIFRDNTFLNTDPNPEIIKRGCGLYAYNSDVWFEGTNTFTNFFTAVNAVSTGGVNAFAIKNAIIDSCFNGIHVSGYPAPIVKNCNIRLPYETYHDKVPTGISVGVVESFSIEGNSVTGSGLGHGIHLSSTSKSGGLLFSNYLEDMQVGILAFGYRNFCRVQLQCNQFSGNRLVDIYNFDGGIDEVQGTHEVSASNKFMGHPNFNIYTSRMPITYYAYPGVYTPGSTSGPISVLKALSLSDCGGNIGIPNPHLTDIARYNDSLNLACDMLLALQDMGETGELVETVEGEDNPLILRNVLLRSSPLLSDTVMVTASADAVPLPNLMLAQVLMSNPQAAKSATVVKALNERENTLPDYLMEAIHDAGSGYSPIDGAKSEIAFHRVNRDILAGRLLARFTADTLGKPYDSIRMLPDYHPDRIYRYLSAFTHVEQGNHEEALAALQSMAGEPGLTPGELQETEGVTRLVNILAGLEQAGIPLELMDSDARANIEEMATQGVGLAALLAGNVLVIADRIPFLAQELALGDAHSGTHSGEWSILLELEPYPVTDYVVAVYDLGSKPCRTPRISVVNSKGDVMYNELLTRSRFQILVKVEGWRPGTYTVQLADGELVLAQRSFLIMGHDGGSEYEESETHELLSNVGISIHPNPTDGQFTIEVRGCGGECRFAYEVIDPSGTTLLTGNGNTSKALSLSHLSKGTYLVVVTLGGERLVQPVVLR